MHRHEDMNTWLLGARGRAGIRKKLGSEISQIREREIEREKTKMKHDLDDKNQKNKDGHTSHYDRIQPGRWIISHQDKSTFFLDEIGQCSHKLKVKREEICPRLECRNWDGMASMWCHWSVYRQQNVSSVCLTIFFFFFWLFLLWNFSISSIGR